MTDRLVVSWTRGPWHMPEPVVGSRRCSGCARTLTSYVTKQGRRSWRHAAPRDYAAEYRRQTFTSPDRGVDYRTVRPHDRADP